MMTDEELKEFFEELKREEEERLKMISHQIEMGCDKCSQWDEYHGCNKCESLLS